MDWKKFYGGLFFFTLIAAVFMKPKNNSRPEMYIQKEIACVFLDDERVPSKVTWNLPNTYPNIPDGSWNIVRSFEEFKGLILGYFYKNERLPDFISFDHDLSAYDSAHFKEQGTGYVYKEKTGLDCAKWLVELCIDYKLEFPAYHVHSLNPVGRENIASYIESFKKS